MSARDAEPDRLAAALAELEAVRRVPGWLPEPPEREPKRRAGRPARRRGPRPDLPPPGQWRYADPESSAVTTPTAGRVAGRADPAASGVALASPVTLAVPASRAARRAEASSNGPPLIRTPVAFRQARIGPGRWAVLGVVVVALVAMSLFATRALLARANSQPQTFGAPAATSVGSMSTSHTGSESPSRATSLGQSSGVSKTATQIEVHVLGEVAKPGVVTVSADARVQDVVRAAGGLLASADLTRVNLARHVQDGEQIVVPKPGQEVATAAGPSAADTGSSTPTSPVDLNAADATALDALPGVGPVLAARIVQYRESNGPFRSIDQLDEVSGIGAKLMEQLRPLVHV